MSQTDIYDAMKNSTTKQVSSKGKFKACDLWIEKY